MTSTDTDGQPDDEARSPLLIIAKLALWAGDLSEAEAQLMRIIESVSPERRRSTVFDDPVIASARRALRQLKRRRSEFHLLAKAAGVAESTREQNPLRSGGRHLSGIVWALNEREFELRAYLTDLSWEAAFYIMVARNSDDAEAQERVRQLGYGLDITKEAEDSKGSIDSADEAVLGVFWVKLIGQLFVQIEVSDFCTFRARGVWIAIDPPKQREQVTEPFQNLLDRIDPIEKGKPK
jgi:hypothetical protein